MNKNDAKVFRWEEINKVQPFPLLERRSIVGEQAVVSEVTLTKGCHVPTHSHTNEQFVIVLSGKILFGLGEEGSPERREVVVQGGEVVFLPSNVPHSAEALEASVFLDVFSPVCQDPGSDRQGQGN